MGAHGLSETPQTIKKPEFTKLIWTYQTDLDLPNWPVKNDYPDLGQNRKKIPHFHKRIGETSPKARRGGVEGELTGLDVHVTLQNVMTRSLFTAPVA